MSDSSGKKSSDKMNSSGSSDELREARRKKQLERAKKNYERRVAEIDKADKRRDKFLETNDERLEKIRARDDELLQKKREKRDARISQNRDRIQKRHVEGNSERQKKFDAATKRTDEFIAKQRDKQNAKIEKHRQEIRRKRAENDKKSRDMREEALIREKNRLKRIEEDKDGSFELRRFKAIIIIGIALFAVLIITEIVLPGTFLKKHEVIDDTPIEEKVSILPSKEYKDLGDMSEDQMLYNLLMEHFDENETAVLGVMCNLKAESKFQASNLEDYNNNLWDLEDDEYTEKVNRKTIEKKDFLESRVKNSTNGFYNDTNQWVNKDGGYGYGQFTSYDKKDDLYEYAETWFGPGGPGEDYKFNIGDPEMQANYVVHLLESDEYKSLDSQIRNADKVVDACFLWLKYYEIPYDPYNDNYFTLAFDRAEPADEIHAQCAPNYKSQKDKGEE